MLNKLVGMCLQFVLCIYIRLISFWFVDRHHESCVPASSRAKAWVKDEPGAEADEEVWSGTIWAFWENSSNGNFRFVLCVYIKTLTIPFSRHMRIINRVFKYVTIELCLFLTLNIMSSYLRQVLFLWQLSSNVKLSWS